MTEPACDQLVEWLGMRLRVPGDWEIVRHSLGTLKGGLTFVDRRKQRLQLRWTRCKKPPLIDKMFDDHVALQRKDHPDALIEPFRLGRWQGLDRDMGEGVRLSRAAWYDASGRVLIEAILSHLDAETELRDEVLESIDIAELLEEATRWAAFGLRIQTPPDFRAASATISAGEATFVFHQLDQPGGEKPRPGRGTLTRMGMADGWFLGNLQKLLEAQNPKNRFDFNEAVLDESQTGNQRATALRATSVEPGPRIKRLAGQLRTRRDLLWHDPDANAVFHIHTLSFDKAPVLADDFLFQPVKEVA